MSLDREDDHFATALGDINDAYLAFKPPKRMSVSQGAAKSLVLKRPGTAATNWSLDSTPYMAEPMDLLASRVHSAVCFVGPAQSGKTAGLGEGWITHAVTNDPGDMLVVQMTEGKAREYSKQRVDRMIENSPNLLALMATSARADNTHDKQFKHGMWLKIAWPTVTNLSSTSYRYVFLTDLDRMPDDLDGEGDPFTLATARIRTFLSRGMVCAESSPGHSITDPNWTKATPHEAPPCKGIIGIYNRGDRRRWYWKCGDCRDWFEAAPGVGLFNLPSERELLEVVRTADLTVLAKHHSSVVCPHCGSMIEYRHRFGMNQRGRWLRDGQMLTADDEVVGEGMNSRIASFWLGGVAAGYQDWEGLLVKHLQGLREYGMTGSETTLQVTVNTDQGMPYLPRYLAEARGNRVSPSERTEKDMQQFVVPDQTRCVVASVDVQGGVDSRFIVQVHAVGPHMEQWLVTRYEIKKSPTRMGMGDEFAQIDPANHPEDWDALTEKVVRATFRTSDPEREIRVKMTVVDSGGEAGATPNAYAWYRRIRKLGLHSRVRLYKGGSVKNAPAIKETLVGARKPGEKGDVPLLICNTNLISDGVDAGLKRQEPGPGFIHFPSWLSPAFFDELGAEVRINGIWTKHKKRNESFDLCRMIRVGMLSLGLDKIVNWARVPTWLAPLAENTETIAKVDRQALQANVVIAAVPDEGPTVSRQPRRVRERRVSRAAL